MNKIVVDNAVLHLLTALSVSEIFTIKVCSSPKYSLLLLTIEPLDLAS